MKKVITIIVSLVMMISFITGCIKTEDDINASESIDESDVLMSHIVGEKVECDDYDVLVHSIKYYTRLDTTYIVVEFTYTNKTSEKLRFESSTDVAVYLDNEMISMVSYPDSDIVNTNLILNTAQINPGRSKTGIVIFATYRNWSTIEVEIKDTIIESDRARCENITPDEELPAETYGSDTSNQSGNPNETSTSLPPRNAFIVDTAMGVYHRPTCSRVASINASDKLEVRASINDLTNGGYIPCEECQPR